MFPYNQVLNKPLVSPHLMWRAQTQLTQTLLRHKTGWWPYSPSCWRWSCDCEFFSSSCTDAFWAAASSHLQHLNLCPSLNWRQASSRLAGPRCHWCLHLMLKQRQRRRTLAGWTRLAERGWWSQRRGQGGQWSACWNTWATWCLMGMVLPVGNGGFCGFCLCSSSPENPSQLFLTLNCSTVGLI